MYYGDGSHWSTSRVLCSYDKLFHHILRKITLYLHYSCFPVVLTFESSVTSTFTLQPSFHSVVFALGISTQQDPPFPSNNQPYESDLRLWMAQQSANNITWYLIPMIITAGGVYVYSKWKLKHRIQTNNYYTKSS